MTEKSTQFPLVSVIIPCFNNEKHIVECLDSLADQTYENLEIVIVNDGSTDNSVEKIKNWKKKNIKLINQENQGVSVARNVGFASSTGDFIQYLDADDFISPNKIESQIQLIKDKENAISNCRCFIYYDEKNIVERKQIVDKSYENPLNWLEDNWLNLTFGATHSWLIPRNLIVKAGPWNERLTKSGDSEFFSRILMNSNSIEYSENAICYYRKHGFGTLSNQKSRITAESTLNSLFLIEKNIFAKHPKFSKKALATQYLSFIYLYYPKFKDLRKIAAERIINLGFKIQDLTYGKRKKFMRMMGFEATLFLHNQLGNMSRNYRKMKRKLK